MILYLIKLEYGIYYENIAKRSKQENNYFKKVVCIAKYGDDENAMVVAL